MTYVIYKKPLYPYGSSSCIKESPHIVKWIDPKFQSQGILVLTDVYKGTITTNYYYKIYVETLQESVSDPRRIMTIVRCLCAKITPCT